MNQRLSKLVLSAAAAALILSAPHAAAVVPGEWVQSTEADFSEGETDDTVVTNLGDIKLAAETETIGEMPEQASIVYDLQQIGEDLYLAAGPEARLLRRNEDAIEEVVGLEGKQVFALDEFDGRLLVAVSGETSELAVLNGDELETIAALDGVRYIWDILVEDGVIFIAAGTEGQVLRIDPETFDAEAEENPGLTVVLDTEQSNVLCLGRDAKGNLYAGTDGEGLIYRLTPGEDGAFEAYVLYDAGEPEIGALLVRTDGTVYAGTADADQARPGRLDEAAGEESGRPDGGESMPAAVEGDEAPGEEPGEVPGEPPAEPTPPDVPEPGPIDDAELEAADQPEPADAGDELTPETPTEVESQTLLRLQSSPEPLDDGLTNDAEQDTPAEPTPEQRDRLRAVVRERLEAARKSGRLQVSPPGGAARTAGGASPSRSRPVETETAVAEGNAVYRIDPEGYVTELFRESVMILRIVPDPADASRLFVATGNEGQVYRIDAAAGETAIIADLEPEQVPAVIADEDGLLLGTANPASLVRLSNLLAATGTFTSDVLDASQPSLFGLLRLTADVPEGCSVLVETRSGNVADPEQAPWSPWSEAQSFMPDEQSPLKPRTMSITSPPARFFQYKLTLTGTGVVSPVVGRVAAAYLTPNMRPKISTLKAAYPEPAEPEAGQEVAEASPTVNVEWEAEDPNGDELTFTIESQPDGSRAWLLVAEDVTDSSYEWNTLLGAPDGWYVVRLTASDALNNPPDMVLTARRRSSPILVDNTAPAFEDLLAVVDGDRATITGTAVDRFSAVHSLAYKIDSEKTWEAVLPDDLICDSTREPFTAKLADLAAGAHVVTLRVTDTRGNVAYEHVPIQSPGSE